jgi:hypothetical protein
MQVAEVRSEITKLKRLRHRTKLKWISAVIVVSSLAAVTFAARDQLNLSALTKQAQLTSKTNETLVWVSAPISLALAGAGIWIYRRRFRGTQPLQRQPSEPRGANLKGKIERLAIDAWGTRDIIVSRKLLLRSETVSKLTSHPEYIKLLLRHVGKVAPNISVPMMPPRIVHEKLCEAAGQFVEEDGWVKIAVGLQFFNDQASAYAILCHELCHYVLGANGIREASTLENERLTDVAMFVFGLGDIFLAGYKRTPSKQYRSGHRLGYLTDEEYKFVDQYVHWLRGSEDFLAKAKSSKDPWNWDRSLR